MAITDILNLTPQLVAEQNPELHQMRKIAFGENYLQDIEQGTGTSQYYSGWGNVPSWAQQAMTTDEAYTTPAVTGTTTSIGVGGGPDAGIMSVAPTTGDQFATARQLMTTPEAYGTDPYGFEDTRALAARNIEPIDPYGFEDTRALAARNIEPIDPFAFEDRARPTIDPYGFEDLKTQSLRPVDAPPMSAEQAANMENIIAKPSNYYADLASQYETIPAMQGAIDFTLQDGEPLGPSFIGTAPFDQTIDEIYAERFDKPPILPEAKPDIYTDRIMDPNLMRIEQERAIEDASYPIAGLSTEQKQLYNQLDTSNLIDPNNAGKDKYGKNIITGADTLGVLGNTYEEGVREYVEKYGDKEYTTPLAQQKQKDYNALVAAWDERDAVTGILPPSRLSPEEIEEAIVPKTYAEKAEDVWKDIEIIEPIAGVELFVNTKTGDTGANIEDVIERPEPAVTTAVAPPSVLAAPVYHAPIAGGGGNGGGGGYSGDPGGGVAGSPFAKGGRVGYKKGGIVDLL